MEDKSKAFKEDLKEWIKTFVSAFAIFLVINIFIVNVRVQGMSMAPNYYPNDFLIVYKLAYKSAEPSYGDVIVFEATNLQEKNLIKRVVGIAGDKIEVANGRVYRNGMLLTEDYIKDGITNGDLSITVGEGEIFVMGDNRLNSLDSRFPEVGLVNKEDVVGKVLARVFPSPQIIK